MDEGHVELDRVEGKLQQVFERGVAYAEVVERHGQPSERMAAIMARAVRGRGWRAFR